MGKFIEVHPIELKGNPFDKIGREWMLVSAGSSGNFNTMTASWGGMGVLWNADVCFAFVRPTRYTYEFMEREDYFSLSFSGRITDTRCGSAALIRGGTSTRRRQRG